MALALQTFGSGSIRDKATPVASAGAGNLFGTHLDGRKFSKAK